MKERQKEIFINLAFSIVFLIASIITFTFLSIGKIINWLEYQFVETLGVILIVFTAFFFFTFLHHIFQKD